MPVEALDFFVCELINKLINMLIPTPTPDQWLSPRVHLHPNPPLPKSINALRLPQEHDLHLIFLRISIYEISNRVIYVVSPMRNVDSLELLNLLNQIVYRLLHPINFFLKFVFHFGLLFLEVDSKLILVLL